MIGTPMTRKILRFEYTVLRAPWTALDAQLRRRLSDGSPLRLTLERGLAGYDTLAGRLLRDPQLVQRGDLLTRHAVAVEQAAARTAEAAELRAAAEQTEHDAAEAADAKRVAAQRRKQQRVAAALEQEQRAEQDAAAAARITAEAKKKQAAERANARKQAATAERTATQRQTSARTERATAPAKATLKDAAAQKTAAAERRSEARRLARLAEVEKHERQAQA